eukprot:1160445-Pelagomonas_calceolata.AAC.3
MASQAPSLEPRQVCQGGHGIKEWAAGKEKEPYGASTRLQLSHELQGLHNDSLQTAWHCMHMLMVSVLFSAEPLLTGSRNKPKPLRPCPSACWPSAAAAILMRTFKLRNKC